MKKLRISDLVWAVFSVLIVTIVTCTTTSPMAAGEHRLPIANFDGYATTITINNPTADFIRLSEGCQVGPCAGVEPFTTFYEYTSQIDGVQTLVLDDRLEAYVEIRDPFGQIVRVGNVGNPTETSLQLQDLKTEGAFRSFLFVHVATGTEIVLRFYRDAVAIASEVVSARPGETLIPAVPAGANRVVVAPGWPWLGIQPSFSVLGLISHQPAGELLIVEPRPVDP